MDLVLTTADVKPEPASAADGHFGGTNFPVINRNTVGSEAMRVHLSVYPPGGYTRGHPIHHDREQAYYVVSGTMTAQIGEREYVAPAGSFIFLPRGVEHNFRNDAGEDLVFLAINCPVRSGDPPPLPDRG